MYIVYLQARLTSIKALLRPHFLWFIVQEF